MTDLPLDPYLVLGLRRTATSEEVKRAYREAAKLLHPDRNAGSGSRDRFAQVLEAYQVLSDPERRAAWDCQHPARQHPARSEGGSDSGSEALTQKDVGLLGSVTRVVGGVLEQVNDGIQRRWSLGTDLRYTVSLSFREALVGCVKEIVFDAPVRCVACGGRGRARQDGGALSACKQCQGEGVVVAERRFELEIPPGSVSGQLTRIPKGGTPGARGGPEGDLTFVLEVEPHPLLTRLGDDLRCVVPVPVTTALAGGPLRVPTLEGSTVLALSPGVQSGQVLRLDGRGVPRPDGTRGDLKITLEVESPAVMPEGLRRLLEEAERQDPSAVFPLSTAFRRKLESTGGAGTDGGTNDG